VSDGDGTILLWEDPALTPLLGYAPPALSAALEKLGPVESVSSARLAETLTRGDIQTLVCPAGPFFLLEAWPALAAFLARGGNFVALGGAPLRIPLLRRSKKLHPQTSTVNYLKRLRINHCHLVNTEAIARYSAPADNPWLAELAPQFRCRRVDELTVRLTDLKDHPADQGSSGPRDGVLRPLLYGLDPHERAACAPVVALDRLKGAYAGGRWVLVTAELETLAAEPDTYAALAAACVVHAHDGAVELDLRPALACYHPGEWPTATIRLRAAQLRRPRASLRLEVRFGEDLVHEDEREVPLNASPQHLNLPVPIELQPGLYAMRAELRHDKRLLAAASSGFWGYDASLLRTGTRLTVDRDYFRAEKRPYPVTGTTYMASDVHRKFALMPNPLVWDRDFEAMKAAGVNMVRTGFWTAFDQMMLEPGVLDQGYLRSLDAFLLTACRHDLPVIFTLFAFLPERWGGVNPYFDPRAVAAQEEYVAALAQRYRDVPGLIWDFINEPSFCSPQRLWTCRPNYDPYERAAWNEWLTARYESLQELADRWRCPLDQLGSWGDVPLPDLCDFEDRYIYQGSYPLRALDYRLFAQEGFNRWLRRMVAAVRAHGSASQLVCVGQDEGGTGERPAPMFHAREVSFTSNHSWWQNDDLLWDSLVTKTPHCPNLIQETGIMFVEAPDGSAWRTEDQCAHLLERKLVLALGADCAGFIQWLWNTNVYMDSDNEVAIGFLRADGTEKPELAAFRRVAAFAAAARELFTGRREPAVVIVIPHSNQFATRSYADGATRCAVRTLHYDCHVAGRCLSEYDLTGLDTARLALLPSPATLRPAAWEELLEWVQAGGTLLVTGPLHSDEHWRPAEHLQPLGLAPVARPVCRHEHLLLDGDRLEFVFGGQKIARLETAVLPDTPEAVLALPHGEGKVLYCPVPAELADNTAPAARLYQYALGQAGVTPTYTSARLPRGILVRPAEFDSGWLYAFVSERGEDVELAFRHTATNTPVTYALPSGRAGLLLLPKDTEAAPLVLAHGRTRVSGAQVDFAGPCVARLGKKGAEVVG